MKNIIFFVFITISISGIITSCSSCSHKKDKSFTEREMEYRSTLTKEDTAAMLKLSDDCMELLKQRKFDDAIAMLNEYDTVKHEVVPLTAKTEQSLRKAFKFFPILKYERTYYSFLLEGLNDVQYKIWFAEEPHPEKNGEPVTKFMFNPIRVDGDWYLCVKGEKQESDPYRR